MVAILWLHGVILLTPSKLGEMRCTDWLDAHVIREPNMMTTALRPHPRTALDFSDSQ